VADDLLKAIKKGDREAVGALLRAGADPNVRAPDRSGLTPLQTAIRELSEDGPLEVVEVLLAHGAEVDRRDCDQASTPLLMAVFRRQRSVAEALLKAGADPNARGDEGDTPICVAAAQGEVEMARLLLDYGAAKTINEGGGVPQSWTPLGAAAARFHLDMLDLLLSAGATVDATDVDGDTALQQAELRWKFVRERLGRQH
jgi:cytohesin